MSPVRGQGRLESWRSLLPTVAMRSSAQLLVGAAFLQFGIFAAGVLVARAEGPRSFGLYSAAFALGSVAVGGATAGLPILMLRRSSEGDLDRHTVRRALGLQLWWSLPAVAVTAAAGAVLFGGWEGAAAAGAAGTFFAASNVATLGKSLQSGRRRYGRAAMADVVAGALFPILTYAALVVGGGNVVALLAISLGCVASSAVVWLRLPDLDRARQPSPLRLLDGFSFSLLGLVKAGYGRIDTVTLALVAGASAAGIYSAAYRLLGPFTLVGVAFSTVYFSRLSEYRTDKARWTRVRRWGTLELAAIAVTGATLLFLAAPVVVELFYGPRFSASVTPARILLLSIVPWALYWPKPSDLASVYLERRATLVLGLGLLLDFALVALAGNRFGATGAAWAWLVAESATLAGLSLASRHISDHVGDAGPPGAPHVPVASPEANADRRSTAPRPAP